MTKKEAIGWLKYAVPIRAVTSDEFSDFITAVNMAIDALKPRKGKWIHECVNSEYSATGCFILRSCECSECGAICEQESYFCPNCGCRMREGDSDEVHN